MVAGKFYPCPFTDRDFFCVTMSRAEMRSISERNRKPGTANVFAENGFAVSMEMGTFPSGECRRNERNRGEISRGRGRVKSKEAKNVQESINRSELRGT